MKSAPQKMLKKHRQLTHSEGLKVLSHTQREHNDWVLHTLMIEGYEVPFQFRRPRNYHSLKGQRVNLTYYPITETIAGLVIEIMRVVRVKRY